MLEFFLLDTLKTTFEYKIYPMDGYNQGLFFQNQDTALDFSPPL